MSAAIQDVSDPSRQVCPRTNGMNVGDYIFFIDRLALASLTTGRPKHGNVLNVRGCVVRRVRCEELYHSCHLTGVSTGGGGDRGFRT